MPKVRKPLQKRRKRGIGYDDQEKVYYVESRSRKNFYHEVQNFDNKWSCNCEHGMMVNFKDACSHIILVVWYIKYQPHLIDIVISVEEFRFKILKPRS